MKKNTELAIVMISLLAAVIGPILTHVLTVRSVRNETVRILAERFDIVNENMRYEEALTTIFASYTRLSNDLYDLQRQLEIIRYDESYVLLRAEYEQLRQELASANDKISQYRREIEVANSYISEYRQEIDRLRE